MPRPAGRLTPWIERLILSYGREEKQEEEEEKDGGRLKAHVIGVGQMSESQARGSEGPTGLLFLSDGVLQIPAVLTASAWEHLQEQEDRECFTSLVNTTVCMQGYQLQFHLGPEQTKSRFFLSVGELATTAAGPVKDSTPCCTTLPAIRLKICRTWRLLVGQDDSQRSQCVFDLSELLGEWHQDCLRAVLDDVRERLGVQPSTSSLTHLATGWDVDRVRNKGAKLFAVPIRRLLIPGEDVRGCLPQSSKPPEPTLSSVDWRLPQPAATERVHDPDEGSPLPVEDAVLHAGMIDRSLSNPWDMYPPPSVTSSSTERSPAETPSPTQSKPDPDPAATAAAILTSTQLSVHNSKESSYFPPYQNQPSGVLTAATTTSVSPDRLASDKHGFGNQEEEDGGEEMIQRRSRKAKRKRSQPTPEALTTAAAEEEEVSGGSPPSWLFDSQTGGCRSEEDAVPEQSVRRRTPSTHSDGQPFSYSYQVSGQNLQDFGHFRVSVSLLHWAVKYLVTPKLPSDGTPVSSV